MRSDQGVAGPVPATPVQALTHDVIGVFYDVYNELGYGFLESVYASAMEIVLQERGFHTSRQPSMDVYFHDRRIGFFRADLVVNGQLVLELKAGPALPPGAKEQLINYLRVSGLSVGLLFHFGPEPKVKRALAPGQQWIDLSTDSI